MNKRNKFLSNLGCVMVTKPKFILVIVLAKLIKGLVDGC